MFDLLIKDGTIIDGTGKPRFRGDIGIRGERIKAVGNPNLPGAEAKKTISAFGKFVTPGFVDITSHADVNWSLFENPGQDYLLTQGVTTILVGNCGTSLAPLASREATESLRKWDHLAEVTINWLTVGEYVAELSKRALGVHIGTLMGHGTIRRGILKGAMRQLTVEELHQFADLLTRGMAEGAFGLSTGLAYSHEAAANHEELTAISRLLAETDGIYKTHLRSESSNLVPAINEAVQIARGSRARVIISHFKAIGRRAWPFFKKTLGMIERANEDGLPFHFDISPYQRTGSFLYLLLPAWAREGGFDPMLERIQNQDTRSRIITELRNQTIHPERYIVATSITPGVNGKTIAEIASRAGQSPEETILELLLANRGRVTVFGNTLSFRNLTLGLAHPLGIIASDGSGVSPALGKSGRLVHPRSTGCFPHFLHKFVRGHQLLSWEEGIHKITSLPAEIVGFKERGRIEKGYHADLVIFDPETIRDRSTYHNPYVHPVGIEAVIVNGELAIENGQLTGTAAGHVLRKA